MRHRVSEKADGRTLHVVHDRTAATKTATGATFCRTDSASIAPRPIMIDQGGGAIVNTMSTSVWIGEDRRVAYQSAKAGLYGLTRHTATLAGVPQDLAAMVAFLFSDDGAYVTGQTILVDGGANFT